MSGTDPATIAFVSGGVEEERPRWWWRRYSANAATEGGAFATTEECRALEGKLTKVVLSGAEWCQKWDELKKVDELILLQKRPEVVV